MDSAPVKANASMDSLKQKEVLEMSLGIVCIGKSDFKKIDDTVDKPFYDRMHHRLQTHYAKGMKKKDKAP